MKIEYFNNPDHVAILVAGDAAGYTAFWYSPVGSTSNMADGSSGIKDIPYITKVIRGATLTKAGR